MIKILKVIVITIAVYSAITFLVSVLFDNDDVNNVLAWGPVGMLLFVFAMPWRRYSRNWFYRVDFKDQDFNIVKTVYSRGEEKPYEKLKMLQETLGDGVEAHSKRVKFIEYIRGRVSNR